MYPKISNSFLVYHIPASITLYERVGHCSMSSSEVFLPVYGVKSTSLYHTTSCSFSTCHGISSGQTRFTIVDSTDVS